MEAGDVLGLLEMEEAFRPVIKKAISTIKEYGPEIYDVAEKIVLATAELRIKQIQKYEEGGFSREDAINMTMDEWYAMARMARNMSGNKKQ